MIRNRARTASTSIVFGTGLFIGFSFGAITGAFVPRADAGPLEDEPGFSCVDDGNRICGPGNTEGKPAGCYDDGGVLVAPWPCHVVVNPATGEGDVHTGLVELGMGSI